MKLFFTYLFWPNPANWHYDQPKVLALLLLFLVFFFSSFLVRRWHHSLKYSISRKLTASWPNALMGFSLVGIFLVVSRVEMIQFVSMRFLWVVWIFSFLTYLLFQWISFRRRHYVVVEKKHVIDLKDRYMPHRKRR